MQFSNFDLENVVSPVNADVLEKLLVESDYNAKKTKRIVEGFRRGFDLGYRGPSNVELTSPNLKFTVEDEVDLWNKVMKEVRVKRCAGPYPIEEPPFKHFIQSPIGLVPKDAGRETRLIFHLSYPRNGSTSVNINTPKRKSKVKYPDFSEAVKLCVGEGRFARLADQMFRPLFAISEFSADSGDFC